MLKRNYIYKLGVITNVTIKLTMSSNDNVNILVCIELLIVVKLLYYLSKITYHIIIKLLYVCKIVFHKLLHHTPRPIRRRIRRLIENKTRREIREAIGGACKWCRKTYNINVDYDECDFIIDRLVENPIDATTLATEHPNTSCRFVENRLFPFVFYNKADYEKQTEEAQKFSDFILKRCLQPRPLLAKFIVNYIKTGNGKPQSKTIFQNLPVNLEYCFTRPTTREEVARYVEYYKARRWYYYRYHGDEMDNGSVIVVPGCDIGGDSKYINFQFNIGENSVDAGDSIVNTGRNSNSLNIIRVMLKTHYHTENEDYDWDYDNYKDVTPYMEDTNCYHTHLRLQHVAYLVEELRKTYDVRAFFHFIPRWLTCNCADESLCPRIPNVADCVSISGKPEVYHNPRGLGGLCLKAMRHSWDWRITDAEKFLPPKLADYYFGAGSEHEHPLCGYSRR